ncbi:MAG: hypothetical protein ACHQHP_00165, partial [Bacteroidia bacterium]
PKTVVSILFILLIPHWGRSQNVGVGADVMYNFQTESFGAGARVSIFPNNTLSFVPEFSYYFPFNKVHEYYLGLALEYKFFRFNKYYLYGIAHGAYDSWLNYQESPMQGAKQNNWNVEAGLGISTNKCLRPFLEYRYNIKFRETHLRLGLLYIFGCSGGSTKGRGFNSRKSLRHCPAYD